MGGQLLEGKRESMFRVDPETLTIIGLDTDDGPEHRLWDERIKLPLDESMVLNVMALGVREPVVVVVEGTGAERRAIVVDGRQRVRYAREANKRLAKAGQPKRDVPVTAEKGMSEEDQQMISISLNENRIDDPVMVKAAKAARMKQAGVSYANIAMAFKVDTQTVAAWVNIHSLTDSVKKAISDGRISPTAASQLAGLSPDKQKESLAELLTAAEKTGEKPTVNNVKRKAKSKKSGSPDSLPIPPRRVLRRVVDNGKEVLSEEFLAGVRFAIGDLNPKSIKGLTALMSSGKEGPAE